MACRGRKTRFGQTATTIITSVSHSAEAFTTSIAGKRMNSTTRKSQKKKTTCDDQTHTQPCHKLQCFEYLQLFFFFLMINACVTETAATPVSCYELIVPRWKAHERKYIRLGQSHDCALQAQRASPPYTLNNSSNNYDQTAEQPRRH